MAESIRTVSKARKRAARKDLEKAIKKHGRHVTAWAWNQITTMSRLRKKLQREKAQIERELKQVEDKLR